MVDLTSQQVWDALDKELFAVISMVNARGQARSSGVVITTVGGRVYFAAAASEWKIRHVRANEHVSVTVPIAKRIPFLPMVKIPPATITFQGTAVVLPPAEASALVVGALTRGLDPTSPELRRMAIVKITPHGDFITYGVGLPMHQMADTQEARGRAPVSHAS